MDKQPKKNKKNGLKDYAKYSGMAMEMFAFILIGILAGKKIDSMLTMEIPLFTMLFSLLGLLLAFYRIFKDLK